MGVTPGTISRTIAKLENMLETRLFHRNTRHLNLTDDGSAFLKDISGPLASLNNAHLRVRENNNCVAGEVRVIMANHFCKIYFMPHLKRLLELYPEITIDLHIADFGPMDLIGGGYDLAVQFGSENGADCIARKIGNLPICLFASPDYLAEHGTPQSLLDLKHHSHILFGRTAKDQFEWRMVNINGENGGQPVLHSGSGRCVITGHIDAGIRAALHGVGIVPFELRGCQRYLESGELKVVLPDWRFVSDDLYLIYTHREHQNARVRAVKEFILEVARQEIDGGCLVARKYAA